MKTGSVVLLLLLGFAACPKQAFPRAPASAQPPAVSLAGENKKILLPGGESFTYAFAQRPQMGTTVLKIKLLDGQGRPRKDLRITGRSGMPSMGSAHDSGDKAFVLNRKGDYLLPVDVAMPGDWEVHVFFYRGDTLIFHGVIPFEV
jgi:hypothetical protein